MRLLPIAPHNLSPALREVHDGIAALIARTQDRIVVLDAQGALVGPFAPMLHFPQFGVPALLFQRTLSSEARLPKAVREVAILTVGAAFGARYELYAQAEDIMFGEDGEMPITPIYWYTLPNLENLSIKDSLFIGPFNDMDLTKVVVTENA